ncbi:MAG TPA: hypothetical protein VEJ47_05390 [Candidatus Eremiobacteraceae bacterium]|nr:hypothetical protein [Candidatus Eremiobacteraceae bacterium]
MQRRVYDPNLVGQSYDYLWTTNTGYLNPYLDRIADRVVAQDELQIFKSRERAQHTANAAVFPAQDAP